MKQTNWLSRLLIDAMAPNLFLALNCLQLWPSGCQLTFPWSNCDCSLQGSCMHLLC